VNVYLQILRRFYGSLLALYPRDYREEYGGELQAVFDFSLDETAQLGSLEVARLVLRELTSLPKAVVLEHLRQRRLKMSGNFASLFDFAPGTRSEIWAAVAPFLLFGVLPTLLGYFRVADFVPLWLEIGFVIVLWSFGLFLVVIGFIKRFPRWFMPYIGLPMPIISTFLWVGVIEPGFDRLPSFSSWFVSEFIIQGLLWIGLFLLVVLLLVSARFIPKSRPFFQRLRDDWTLLAFILYGIMPFALVIVLNEYKNEEPYMFLALLILAAGGWLYLRSDGPWNRFIYLQCGMGFSMLVAAIAKALLVETSFPFVGDDDWRTEFMSTIISWMWLTLIMMIPLILKLLPRSKEPLRTT
jgi:hypothetical protein